MGKKASQERLVSRINALGSQVAEGHEKSLAENLNFHTRHYIILASILYRVRALTSHNTEESENSPDSPHLGEIKRMRKQCVPGGPPFFARAGDEAISHQVLQVMRASSKQ